MTPWYTVVSGKTCKCLAAVLAQFFGDNIRALFCSYMDFDWSKPSIVLIAVRTPCTIGWPVFPAIILILRLSPAATAPQRQWALNLHDERVQAFQCAPNENACLAIVLPAVNALWHRHLAVSLERFRTTRDLASSEHLLCCKFADVHSSGSDDPGFVPT